MNTGTRPVKGVIFDNDDTAQAHDPELGYGSPEDQYYAGFAAIAACFGKTLEKESDLRLRVMGIDIRDVGAAMISELSLPLSYDQWKQALDAVLLALAPFAALAPGFEDCILTLQERGLKTGIASSSVRRVLDAKWERFPTTRQQMSCFVAGDDVARSKPEPDLLLRAASEMNLPPSECIYVGDSRSDLLAAERAGMIPVLFRHPGRAIAGVPQNTIEIRAFSDLLSVV